MVGMLLNHFPAGSGLCTTFNDPSNWTLAQEWDSRDGDLSSIKSSFSLARMNGFAWNPAGTRLTICNTSDDVIRTFTCSTPFDPDTASTHATRSVTNPQWLQFNTAGTVAYVIFNVGDVIQALPASGFSIGAGDVLSDLSKSDVGFTGTSDGGFSMSHDESFLLYFGQTGTAEEVKKVTFTDLDNFSVAATESINPPITSVNLGVQDATKLSTDYKYFYYNQDGGGVRLATMSTPADISTLSWGAQTDLDALFSPASDWAITDIWIDPYDTKFAWVAGETGAGEIQMAKFTTSACP